MSAVPVVPAHGTKPHPLDALPLASYRLMLQQWLRNKDEDAKRIYDGSPDEFLEFLADPSDNVACATYHAHRLQVALLEYLKMPPREKRDMKLERRLDEFLQSSPPKLWNQLYQEARSPKRRQLIRRLLWVLSDEEGRREEGVAKKDDLEWIEREFPQTHNRPYRFASELRERLLEEVEQLRLAENRAKLRSPSAKDKLYLEWLRGAIRLINHIKMHNNNALDIGEIELESLTARIILEFYWRTGNRKSTIRDSAEELIGVLGASHRSRDWNAKELPDYVDEICKKLNKVAASGELEKSLDAEPANYFDRLDGELKSGLITKAYNLAEELPQIDATAAMTVVNKIRQASANRKIERPLHKVEVEFTDKVLHYLSIVHQDASADLSATPLPRPGAQEWKASRPSALCSQAANEPRTAGDEQSDQLTQNAKEAEFLETYAREIRKYNFQFDNNCDAGPIDLDNIEKEIYSKNEYSMHGIKMRIKNGSFQVQSIGRYCQKVLDVVSRKFVHWGMVDAASADIVFIRIARSRRQQPTNCI